MLKGMENEERYKKAKPIFFHARRQISTIDGLYDKKNDT